MKTQCMSIADMSTDNVSDKFAGKFLIANPYSTLGDVFNKSLIYVASHTDQGAIGMIVNRLVNKLQFKAVMKLLNDNGDNEGDILMPIYLGGPVEPERGFILHTAEYDKNLLLKFSDNLAVSSNIEILKDIANGIGPQNSLFVLGYTGWEAGQLEEEMNSNMWLVSECDKNLIFSQDNENKWDIALQNIGIHNSMLTPGVGHC
jgi:putative transcriptional regulator